MTFPKLHVCVLSITLAIVSQNYTKAENKNEGVRTEEASVGNANLGFTTGKQNVYYSSSEVQTVTDSTISPLEDTEIKTDIDTHVPGQDKLKTNFNSKEDVTKSSTRFSSSLFSHISTDSYNVKVPDIAESKEEPLATTASTRTPKDRDEYEDAYKRLQEYIFSKPSVVNRIPPYDLLYSNDSDKIFVRFTPFKVLAVDEVEQSVTISCYISIKWVDFNLNWDPNDYGGITNISVKTSQVWTPVIFLPTSNGHGLYVNLPEYLMVRHKRRHFSVTVPFQFTVLCELDLSMYPFDEQECEIIFTELHGYVISGKDNRKQEFQLIKNLDSAGEWKIVENKTADTTWDGQFSSVRHIIKIQRRSIFYLANFLIPLALTSFMTLLVFWIPAESGEKMSFLVSMFVSTSVFLFIINDEIPRSIINLPPVNIMITAVICEIFAASVATLFVLRRYRHSVNSNTKDTTPSQMETFKLKDVQNSQDKTWDPKRGHQTTRNRSSEPEHKQPVWHTNLFSEVPAPPYEEKESKFYKSGSYDFLNKETQTCHRDDLSGCFSHVTLDYLFFSVFLVLNIIGGVYLCLSLT